MSANTLQKLDKEERDQSIQLSPISTIIDIKSLNYNQIPQLSEKSKTFNYKHRTFKSPLLFVKTLEKSRDNHSKTQASTESKKPRGRTTKTSRLIGAQVTYNPEVNSDFSPKNNTPATNNSTDTTPSTNTQYAVEDKRLTVTINKILSKKLLAIFTGRNLEKSERLGHAQR